MARQGGWLARLKVWMAVLVARLLATAHLWVRIQASLKNHKMGNISKEMASTSCSVTPFP